jgi:hypothetical protein
VIVARRSRDPNAPTDEQLIAAARVDAPVVLDWIRERGRLPVTPPPGGDVTESLVAGMLTAIVKASKLAYLAQFPKARAKNTYVMTYSRTDGFSEWDYSCLFCRASLNTLPPGGGTLPRAFVDKLHRHTHECAAAYLADMMTPSPPPRAKKGSRR